MIFDGKSQLMNTFCEIQWLEEISNTRLVLLFCKVYTFKQNVINIKPINAHQKLLAAI